MRRQLEWFRTWIVLAVLLEAATQFAQPAFLALQSPVERQLYAWRPSAQW